MQLKPPPAPIQKNKKPQRIRESLALATCSLLAIAPPQVVAEDNLSPWEIESALLIYAEKDRVQLAEPVLSLRKEIDDEEFIGIRIVADALTGSSPNGAAPSDAPQTFTSPSGEKTYSTPAGETPLDDTFTDVRSALNVTWEKPLTTDLGAVFGINFSKEHDYTSLGLSTSFAYDFNQRHTTLNISASVNRDDLNPEGNAPVGLTEMPTFPATKATQGKNQKKNINELLIGITQIINRSTLTQVNYSHGQSDGYLNDPYKVLSVLENDGSGDLRTTANPYVFENRPDKRSYQSIFWKGIHQLENENVVTVSYRYFWDDWDITSHTVDLRYRWEMGSGHYLQPHLRYYQQNAAEFYRQTLIDGEELTLNYASADYRLGDFTSQTIGLKYGVEFSNGAEINLRVETMQQRGETRSQDAVGKLQHVDLYPDLDAIIVQAGLSLDADILSKFMRKLFGKK